MSFYPIGCAWLSLPSPLFYVLYGPFANIQTATNTSPTRAITLVQAILHICTLTLPVGARGQQSSHSTDPGNQPLGIQNSGALAYHNCKNSRSPFVTNHLTECMMVVNCVLLEDTEVDVLLCSSDTLSCCRRSFAQRAKSSCGETANISLFSRNNSMCWLLARRVRAETGDGM